MRDNTVKNIEAMCCACKKFRVDDVWTIKEPPISENISHTYCPECAAHTMKEIEKRKGL